MTLHYVFWEIRKFWENSWNDISLKLKTKKSLESRMSSGVGVSLFRRSGLVSSVWGSMSSTTCRFLSDAVNSQKRQLNVAKSPPSSSYYSFKHGTVERSAVLLYSLFSSGFVLLIILAFQILGLCQCRESQSYLFITDYSSSTVVFSQDLILSIYGLHKILHVNS